MKNKKRIRTIVCIVLAAAGLTAIGALAAGGAGSQSDPLVTLSYLTDTFTGQIMDKVDAAIAQRNTQLLQELGRSGAADSGEASTYTAVTLAAGQTLYGEAGCALFRQGAAALRRGQLRRDGLRGADGRHHRRQPERRQCAGGQPSLPDAGERQRLRCRRRGAAGPRRLCRRSVRGDTAYENHP